MSRAEPRRMELGVSTLGCPDWTLEQILKRCPACGYAGIEWRGLGPELDLAHSPAFSTPAAAARTRRALADVGLVTCGVDASARLTGGDESAWAGHRDDARRMIDLAVLLGAPLVRVFGGDGPAALAAARLRELGEYAAQAGDGVRVDLETHDGFSTGARVAEVLALADHPRAGALWDLHHPYRQGEAPERTWAALSPSVGRVHVKDSRPDGRYCLLGEGDVPVRKMLALLAHDHFDGWVTVEWEKRWHPDIADPEIAFPQYARVLAQWWTELTA